MLLLLYILKLIFWVSPKFYSGIATGNVTLPFNSRTFRPNYFLFGFSAFVLWCAQLEHIVLNNLKVCVSVTRLWNTLRFLLNILWFFLFETYYLNHPLQFTSCGLLWELPNLHLLLRYDYDWILFLLTKISN